MPVLKERFQEELLNIIGYGNACDNGRPKLDRWRGDKSGRECNHIEIVSKVRHSPTMPRPTEYAGMTLAIVTGAAEVLSDTIG